MLKLVWHSTTIVSNKQANDMVNLFREVKPTVGGFDTETTGLHIINSQPFLFQFGFIHPNWKEGYTFAVDIEKQPNLARAVIKAWHKLAETLEIYLAHNIKYDLHMMANYGEAYTKENVSDTMFYIRYAHDNLQFREGGPPLGLKEYASKYIDRKANYHEKLLAAEKSEIAKELNIRLKSRLNVTIGAIKDMFKDTIVDYEDLEQDLKERYLDWLREDVPIYIQNKVTSLITPDMIPYNKLNRTNLIKYAHFDIIYMLEIYLITAPAIEVRENQEGIKMENSLIYPFWEMERCGFAVDKEYLYNCKTKMKNYIKERRQRLYEIAGQELSVGQHALIKDLFYKIFNIELVSTNASELELLISTLKREGHTKAVEFIEIIQELRTLEKWYSTYIIRFINDLKNSNRLYTTINQVGTVSGRVTSDFQQFPKDGIVTIRGEEIFKPRRMVKASGGDYNTLVYLDFSQIELRFQAFYTILVGHPDTNLCRAYMPYDCVNANGKLFDYNSYTDICNWEGDWYYKENPTLKWTPTDVHGATTIEAFGVIEDKEEFKKLRYVGKRVNFAKNYGAQRGKIREMFPEYSEEQITKINDAYYNAFPGVKQYHNYCYSRAEQHSCTSNMFGVKYYGVSGHKLINMLVQGSSAFYLKWKIREIYNLSKQLKVKTKIQMQIHDELSWEAHKDDGPELFFQFKKVMQEWSDTLVPVVAEMEATNTTWAEKKEIKSVEKLREVLYEI